MEFSRAIKKAMSEDKEIALPPNEHCQNDGYLIKIKPFPNNLVCSEFYGNKKTINQFSISPKEIVRDDWIVV